MALDGCRDMGRGRSRCIALLKGLEVVTIFQDDMTGSLATRPGMQAMLAYLRKHSKKGKERIVVIIDDISRLARGIEAHLKLRAAIGSAGGILKSPTIEFGEGLRLHSGREPSRQRFPAPYYLCYNRDCPSCRKSIPRDKLEGAFDGIISGLQPSEGVATVARAMFREAWDQRVAQGKAVQVQIKTMLTDLAKQVDQMLARVVAADSPAVIRAYEMKIAELETQKLALTEKLDKQSEPQHSFEELFELALWFLSNPWKLWSSGQFHFAAHRAQIGFPGGGAPTPERAGFQTSKPQCLSGS
jgi:hypothetical protein